ncbi:hypothetical protein RDI58_001186 [Solanum bulbocastanum]|uniref:DUF1985 domain-containing protein n=1 Tax=Solanum bulbocastanum TaxID=147425 RepID=A0AAN8YT16_SOLBU
MSIYDSDDENWADNRSKKLHDPLNMRNQLNKEVPKSYKSNVEKAHPKRERKVAPAIARSSLPRDDPNSFLTQHPLLDEHLIFHFDMQHPIHSQLPLAPSSMKYVIKKVPRHALRFGAPYNTNFLEEFKKSIGFDVVELFRATIFGTYLHIPKYNFQEQITKCLLLLELEQNNSKVLHIRHVNGSILNFDIKEFALITGLKCKGNTKDFAYPDSTLCSYRVDPWG